MGKICVVAPLALCLLAAPALAKTKGYANALAASKAANTSPLVVIQDRGGIPIDEIISDGMEYDDPRAGVPSLDQKLEAEGGRVHGGNYPVVTDSMSIGPIGPQEGRVEHLFGAMAYPIFIIGWDRVSMNWLRANREILEENKALGFVVNVDSHESMQQIQAIAGDRLYLSAVNGDDISETFDLYHYPAYIDHDGVLR